VDKILNMARPTGVGVDAAQHAVRAALAEKNAKRPQVVTRDGDKRLSPVRSRI
jgi:hypothetical protein